MQQHVGRAEAEVVAAPDHVAQVVVHVLVGMEGQQRELQTERLGQRPGQLDVDALAVDVEGRHVLVDADHQRAPLAHLVQRDGARRGRGTEAGRARAPARASRRAVRGSGHRGAPAQSGFSRRVSR
ncbi:hypothetical protein ABXN37_04730 [Piscinibacter sakaiensis]|uniref:hypothetical protein n=1 Tax=Piscinibacter sakaiensis TaxID=1547922 RepID=UPI0037285333